MKPVIYEPEDIGSLDDIADTVPNIELLKGRLRLHFHVSGLSFGLIHLEDQRFSACISYKQVREMMMEEARKGKKK